MNPKSAEALVGAAVIANLAGFFVLNPTAWLGFCIIAAISAAIPAVFASGGPRVAGLVVLVASIAHAIWAYPAHDRYETRLINSSKARAEKSNSPAPPPVLTKDK